jgi:DNA-directed RNA polymerase specialized sigma24 family protein
LTGAPRTVNRDSAVEGDTDTSFDGVHLAVRLAATLETLPPRQQLVLTLRIMHGRTIKATANAILISENTVRSSTS